MKINTSPKTSVYLYCHFHLPTSSTIVVADYETTFCSESTENVKIKLMIKKRLTRANSSKNDLHRICIDISYNNNRIFDRRE